MKQKKGQLTLFIIIGIVAVVIIGSALYFRLYKYNDDYVPTSMAPIKNYVDSCLTNTAEGAVLLAGAQGGVIYFGDVIPNAETSYSFATYWYDKGQDVSISKEFIENEINRYIEEELDTRCAAGFEELHANILRGNVTSEISINDGDVLVSVNYPVTLVEGESRITISKFSVDIPAKLGKSIGIAKKIVDMEIKDPNYVSISDLGQMDMLVVPYTYSDNIMLYSLVDETNKVKGINFKLVFANRFGDESSGNRDPKILNGDNLYFSVGKESEYQFVAFDADNDPLTWYSTGRPLVSRDGKLTFKPTEEDVGEHSINVIVIDGNGGRDSQIIKLIVEGK